MVRISVIVAVSAEKIFPAISVTNCGNEFISYDSELLMHRWLPKSKDA